MNLIGLRVKYSESGAALFSTVDTSREGKIVGRCRPNQYGTGSRCFHILWDGRKSSEILHEDFFELVTK